MQKSFDEKNRLDGMGNSIEDCRSWKDWTDGEFYASALLSTNNGGLEERRQLLTG